MEDLDRIESGNAQVFIGVDFGRISNPIDVVAMSLNEDDEVIGWRKLGDNAKITYKDNEE